MVHVGNDTTEYDNKGNITRQSPVGAFQYTISGKPYAISGVTPSGSAIPLRSQTISYTSFMRPDSIIENNNFVAFTYNVAGDRVRTRSTLGSSLVYDRFYAGGNYMVDVNASTTNEYLYLGGDAYSAPAVYIKNSTGNWNIHYICRDYLGSITHVTNSSGSLEQELSYDVWGRLRNPATQEPYTPGNEPVLYLGRGYTGHEHLTAFGLINMNSRLYDPALGRFLSPDPYIQAPDHSQNFNRYSYCLNNPLKFTDPSGNSWISDKIGQFQKWFDQHPGSWLYNHGITSFSFGTNVSYTPGKSNVDFYTGGGIGIANHQEIIMGNSFSRNMKSGDGISKGQFGFGTSYSNPYYPSTYDAPEQTAANAFNNARGDYFEAAGQGSSDFDNWGSNFRTAAGLTFNWLVGAGKESYIFINSPAANAFRNSRGINQARENYYNKGTTSGGYSFGLKDLFYYAGLDPIEQFVGSYNYNLKVVGDNLQYVITNTTSFSSASYHIWPSSWNWNSGPMGNDNQTYIFTESLRIKK